MYETPLSSFSKIYDHSGGVLTLSVHFLPFGREVLKHREMQNEIIFLFINKK